jgi:hypothetical protein
VSPKPTVSAVQAQPSKQAASPTGLQLSTAQWKAYNSAYTASATAGYRNLAIQASALTLRQSRLNAVYSLRKKVAAAHSAARTAAIAAFAARMSFKQSQQAHQNTALRNRVLANYERHVQQTSQLQFAYKGEKLYLHQAISSTLTAAQSVSAETAFFARAVKTAKAAVTSVSTPAASTTPLSPAAARVQAAAAAAGLAAARATPVGRTAPRPDRELAAQPWQESPWCGAWRGDPDGNDCVAAAIANHLLYARRLYHSEARYSILKKELELNWPDGPPIAEALDYVQDRWHFLDWPRLVDYRSDVDVFGLLPGAVIGFTTANGPHAALYLGDGLIASWSEVLRLQEVLLPGTDVEEAWRLEWAVG